MSTTTKQIITSGSWSKSGKGNFTAYTATGTQFFVPGRLMDAIGVNVGDQPTFPLYGFSTTKQIGVFIPGTTDLQMEADGVTPVQQDRVEITALFKDKASFADVANAEFGLDLELREHRRSLAKTAGLDEEAVNKLLEVSF
jgi:hypothetical protein